MYMIHGLSAHPSAAVPTRGERARAMAALRPLGASHGACGFMFHPDGPPYWIRNRYKFMMSEI